MLPVFLQMVDVAVTVKECNIKWKAVAFGNLLHKVADYFSLRNSRITAQLPHSIECFCVNAPSPDCIFRQDQYLPLKNERKKLIIIKSLNYYFL